MSADELGSCLTDGTFSAPDFFRLEGSAQYIELTLDLGGKFIGRVPMGSEPAGDSFANTSASSVRSEYGRGRHRMANLRFTRSSGRQPPAASCTTTDRPLPP